MSQNRQSLAQFQGKKYMSLETFRKSGEGVRTPVWFVEDSGILYVTTTSATGKAKRIRNGSRVRFAPCDLRGNVEGEWTDGDAVITTGEESRKGSRLLTRKYGVFKRLFDFAYNFAKGDVTIIRIQLSGGNSGAREE